MPYFKIGKNKKFAENFSDRKQLDLASYIKVTNKVKTKSETKWSWSAFDDLKVEESRKNPWTTDRGACPGKHLPG